MKKSELGQLLNHALQKSYRHQLVLAKLYRALAERELNSSQQELLLLLAQSSEDAAKRYAQRLQGLGISPPPDYDLWRDRIWRFLLVRCGISGVMAWTRWMENGDFNSYMRFVEAIPPVISHSEF
jgi:hypothetical protein